jgi:RES domain-containing protein
VAEPAGWNADEALAEVQSKPWRGRAWRAHWRVYSATDHGGSLHFSGRYNRGLDRFPAGNTWPALYLALSAEIALGEIFRHVTPEMFRRLNDFRLSELDVDLSAVLDCRDMQALGLRLEDLVHDYDFDVSQRLAFAAIGRSAEAILVPSATRLGDNLIVFPAQRRAASGLTAVSSRDPRLYVPR